MKRILLCVLLASLPGAAVAAQQSFQELRRTAAQALLNKDYPDAIAVYAKILAAEPNDSLALYNTACAYALLGNKADAARFLEKAVAAGFIDFTHIETDADLDSIRMEDGYKRVLARKAEIDRQVIEARAADLRKTLGAAYEAYRDETKKILVLSDLPKSEVTGLFQAIAVFQNALHASLFDHLPDYWNLIVIPAKPDDYTKLRGSAISAGSYNPATHTLAVNITTGIGSMIHEWTHAMNFADQAARRQSQPLWMLEGLGSLYEEVRLEDRRLIGLTNFRLVQIQTMIQNGSIRPMRDFITNSEKYFEQDPFAAYAQARYIFYYLQEKGLLQKFYRTYNESYPEDATGIVALEKVLGRKVEDWVGEWKEFTARLTLGEVPKPKIGIQVTNEDKGVKVVAVTENGGADKGGLKIDDVIVAADGQRVPLASDVQKIIDTKARGDSIELKVMRNGQELTIKVTLQ
jgi:tetratricopeptide (TPR) repeat protein